MKSKKQSINNEYFCDVYVIGFVLVFYTGVLAPYSILTLRGEGLTKIDSQAIIDSKYAFMNGCYSNKYEIGSGYKQGRTHADYKDRSNVIYPGRWKIQ